MGMLVSYMAEVAHTGDIVLESETLWLAKMKFMHEFNNTKKLMELKGSENLLFG